MRNTKAALEWIVGILKTNKTPFQVDGGLAAKIYGSNRPLADIDLVVPNDAIYVIEPTVREYIKFGPARYKDDQWDLLLMSLRYMDQDIDISGADEAKIFDKNKNEWTETEIDFNNSEIVEIFGMHLPVIPKKQLINEKSELSRPVDIEDIRAIG